jgi:transcriptional regulator with XRE-family HTH domain
MPEIAYAIDLNLRQKLQDRSYRLKFFWAESSARIAEALIALRKRRGLNQAQVAELTGTKQPAISRVEQADYQNWNIKTLRTIAEALDARVRVLIQPSEDVLKEYDDDVNADVEVDINTESIQPNVFIDQRPLVLGGNTFRSQRDLFANATIYDQTALGHLTPPPAFTATRMVVPWMSENPATPFSVEDEKIRLRRVVAQQQKIIAEKDEEIAALSNMRSSSSTLELGQTTQWLLGQGGSASIEIRLQ